MRRLPALLALAAASAAALPAAAGEGPLPPTPTNYVYARSMAIGAYRGLAGDNDAIFYNPATLAARKRFDLNLGGLMYRVGSDTDATRAWAMRRSKGSLRRESTRTRWGHREGGRT